MSDIRAEMCLLIQKMKKLRTGVEAKIAQEVKCEEEEEEKKSLRESTNVCTRRNGIPRCRAGEN